MAYLGKSPSQGVRNRYYFTASGGETSISGALTGGTLTFTDGNYVDVNLNGVTLVAGTDYNTSTANTIAGLSALTASDVVEIVVYDVFSVFSGNVNSDFSVGGNLSVTGTTAFTGATTITGLTTTGDINFGDNDKAIFGAGSDLQITHTGSHSQIVDSGTGGLFIGGSSQIGLMNAALNEYMVNAVENGAVTLYHDNAAKIATTSSGVSVTGQVIATKGSTGTLATFTDGVATNFTFKTDGSSVGTFGTEAGSTQLAFMVANTEAARFDGSRNLLVGKTSSNIGTAGSEVTPTYISATRADNSPLFLNRTSSDGSIITFRKDNSAAGSIGVINNNNLIISNDADNSGLQFGSGSITPAYDGAGQDNSVDLGSSSTRFKDLYLSGGAYLGGTGSANKLDDYEEGTWTPTASGGYTVSSASGAYTKIGRVVHLWGTVQFSAVGGNTSTVVLGSAPFTNSTHLGTGVCRENTNTGAIYVFRVAPNSTSMEINTMTGVASGTRTIRTGENYAFHGSYYVA